MNFIRRNKAGICLAAVICIIISILPPVAGASELVEELSISVDEIKREVLVVGRVSSRRQNHRVTLTVFKAGEHEAGPTLQNLCHIEQQETGIGGQFEFIYIMDKDLDIGNYTARIGGDNIAGAYAQANFLYMKEDVIHIDEPVFTKDNGEDPGDRLWPGEYIKATVNAKNRDSQAQDVVLIGALFDKKDNLSNVSHIKKTFSAPEWSYDGEKWVHSNQEESDGELVARMYVPTDGEDYYFRLYIWETMDNMKSIKSDIMIYPQSAVEAYMDKKDDELRLKIVMEFADNVLNYGRDVYGTQHTPLFVDGFNIVDRKPVEWLYDGDVLIPSNLSSQQNLLRTLTGLTNLTGKQAYKEAAKEQFSYHFDNLASDCGLLKWGPHVFIDLDNTEKYLEKPVFSSSQIHEFKYNMPFYELMWEVDPGDTENFIKALWNAHVMKWDDLSINRHAYYNIPMGDIWDSTYIDSLFGKEGFERIFVADGLSFLNTGTDLTYAGILLSKLGGSPAPGEWGKKLANLYVAARHPETKLGTTQYTQIRQTRFDLPDSNANSAGGDRAKRQFGPEFGDYALEAYTLLTTSQAVLQNAVSQLYLYETTGDEEFLNWTLEGMRAFIQHQYNPEDDMVRPMLADGTDLTGYTLPRDGYYGIKGRILQPIRANIMALLSISKAYRLTNDSDLWDTIRAMAKHRGLGDFGIKPGGDTELNYKTSASSPTILLSIIEIYRATGEESYLKLARIVGNNIIKYKYNGGFFVDRGRMNAKFDAIEPLALLTLEAVIRGDIEAVPAYVGGEGFIDANYDGLGRVTDNNIIYNH